MLLMVSIFFATGCAGPRFIKTVRISGQAPEPREIHVFCKTLHRKINGRKTFEGNSSVLDAYGYRTVCSMKLPRDYWTDLGWTVATCGAMLVIYPMEFYTKDLPPQDSPSDKVAMLRKALPEFNIYDDSLHYPDAESFLSSNDQTSGVIYTVYQVCDLEGDQRNYEVSSGWYKPFDIPTLGVMLQLYRNFEGTHKKLIDYREILWPKLLSKKTLSVGDKNYGSFETRETLNEKAANAVAQEIREILLNDF